MGNTTNEISMNYRQMYNFMVDIWKLYQEYAVSALTDEIMETFIEKVDQLRIKYQGNNFTNTVLIALATEIGLIAKSKEGR